MGPIGLMGPMWPAQPTTAMPTADPVTAADSGNLSPANPALLVAADGGNVSPADPALLVSAAAGNVSPASPGLVSAAAGVNLSPATPPALSGAAGGNLSPAAPGLILTATAAGSILISGTLVPDVSGLLDPYTDAYGYAAWSLGGVDVTGGTYSGPGITYNRFGGYWVIQNFSNGAGSLPHWDSTEDIAAAPTPDLATWTPSGDASGVPSLTGTAAVPEAIAPAAAGNLSPSAPGAIA